MTGFFTDFPPWLLSAVLAGFWLSGIAKGLMGFGQPLVAAALVSFLIPIETVLVVNALLMPFTNLAQFLAARMAAETMKKTWPVILGLAVGVPIGAHFAASTSEAVLSLCMGGFVAAFSLLLSAAPRFRIPPRLERPLGLATGVAAGIVGALTTANGPIFVMHFAGLRISRRLFISAVGCLFFISGLMISAAFSFAGVMSLSGAILAAACLPMVVLGMRVGNKLGKRVSEVKFRKIILAALFFLGCGLVWRGGDAIY